MVVKRNTIKTMLKDHCVNQYQKMLNKTKLYNSICPPVFELLVYIFACLNNKTTFLPILFNVDFYLPVSHQALSMVIFGFTAPHEMFKRKATIFLLKLFIKPVMKCLLP